MSREPTIEMLDEIFRLDRETGKLYWRHNRFAGFDGKTPTALAGTEAGTLYTGRLGEQYRYVGIGLRRYRVHRIIFAMVNRRWPVFHIDHIDGDGLNNRPSNLREATQAENNCNRGPQCNNRSGVKGVYWDKKKGKWAVHLCANGKRMAFGRYDDLELAALVRDEAARKYHGEFARLNYSR